MPKVLRSVNFRPVIPSGSFGRGFSSYANRELPALRKDMHQKWGNIAKSDWKAQHYGVPYEYLATLFAMRHEHLKASPDEEPFPSAMWSPLTPLPEGLATSLDIYYTKRDRLLLLEQPWVKQDFLDDDDILQKANLNWKHYTPTIRMSEEEAQSLERLPSSDINEMKKTASQSLPESEDDESDDESKGDSDPNIGTIYDDPVGRDDDVDMDYNDDDEPIAVKPAKKVRPTKPSHRAGRELQLVDNENRKSDSLCLASY